jgi:hypothetical protein
MENDNDQIRPFGQIEGNDVPPHADPITFTYLTEDGRRWLLTAVELPREDA